MRMIDQRWLTKASETATFGRIVAFAAAAAQPPTGDGVGLVLDIVRRPRRKHQIFRFEEA